MAAAVVPGVYQFEQSWGSRSSNTMRLTLKEDGTAEYYEQDVRDREEGAPTLFLRDAQIVEGARVKLRPERERKGSVTNIYGQPVADTNLLSEEGLVSGRDHKRVVVSFKSFLAPINCEATDLEFVDDGSIQVGCRVRLRRNLQNPVYGWGHVKPGSVGILLRIEPDDIYRIRFPAHPSWKGKNHEIERADAEDVATCKRRKLLSRAPGGVLADGIGFDKTGTTIDDMACTVMRPLPPPPKKEIIRTATYTGSWSVDAGVVHFVASEHCGWFCWDQEITSPSSHAVDFLVLADFLLAQKSDVGVAMCNGEPVFFSKEGEFSDPELALGAVKVHGAALEFANSVICNNKEIVMTALASDSSTYTLVSEELKSDTDVVMKALQGDALNLHFAPASVQGDKAIVLMAVTSNGCALEFAADDLKSDPEVVRAAVKQDGSAIRFVAESARQPVFLDALATYPQGLYLAPASCFEDKATILQVVAMGGFAAGTVLEKLNGVASPHLQDREVALALVSANGHLLNQLPPDLAEDRDIVLAAIEQDVRSFRYAPENIRADKDVALQVVQISGMALEHASEALRNDPEVVTAAIRQDRQALQFASEALQEDPEILNAFLDKDVD